MDNPKVFYFEYFPVKRPTVCEASTALSVILNERWTEASIQETLVNLLGSLEETVCQNTFTAFIRWISQDPHPSLNTLAAMCTAKCSRCQHKVNISSFLHPEGHLSKQCNSCRAQNVVQEHQKLIYLKEDNTEPPTYSSIFEMLDLSFSACRSLHFGFECHIRVRKSGSRQHVEQWFLHALETNFGLMHIAHTKQGKRAYYICSQKRKKKPLPESANEHVRKRLRQSKKIFDCQGSISFVEEKDGSIFVSMKHGSMHVRPKIPCVLTTAQKEMVENLSIQGMVPFQILSQIRTTTPVSFTSYVPYQTVYNHWMKTISNSCRLDDDPFISTKMYILKAQNVDFLFEHDKPRALGFTTALGRTIVSKHNVVELFIDSTFKTNSQSMELFSVIASINGVGFPIAYMVVEPFANADFMYRKHLLTSFLVCLKERLKNLQPLFVFTDKESSQMSAIQKAFNTYPSLCLWHILRAIKRKIHDMRSRTKEIISDRMEAILLNLIREHYLAHHFFGNAETDTNIFRMQCRNEIELLCSGFVLTAPNAAGKHIRTAFEREVEVQELEVQHYLFENWYDEYTFLCWGRRKNDYIPFARTTMFVESHWSVLKQSYFRNYNRPRMDFVVFILDTRFLVKFSHDYRGLMSGHYKPSWWGDFVQDWKRFQKQKSDCTNSSLPMGQFYCNCRVFRRNRFFLCKHTVKEQNPPNYEHLIRSRRPPFMSVDSHREDLIPFFPEKRRSEKFESERLEPMLLQPQDSVEIEECTFNLREDADNLLEKLRWSTSHIEYLVESGSNEQYQVLKRSLEPHLRYMHNVRATLRAKTKQKTWANNAVLYLK